MNKTNEEPLEQSAVPRTNQNKKHKIVRITTVALLAGVIAAGGWLYYDSSKTIRSQNSLISNLQKQVKDRGQLSANASGSGTKTPGASPNCNGGSDYTANIGKFSVTVSDPNVIVRSIDAGYEGGPITQLSIGRCVSGETNIVDVYPPNEVKILGHPAANAATLRSNFESQWGTPLAPSGTLSVGGVTANVYTASGLFNPKLVYFDHGGIGYQIELTDANATSEAILTDITADWSFTP